MTLNVDVYPWFALISSVAMLALFSSHVLDASTSYRTHHDDRAAYDLLIALTLAVTALGLTVSSVAAFIDPLGIAGRSEMRNLGLGIVRGSLLITASTMWLADRHSRLFGQERRKGDAHKA